MKEKNTSPRAPMMAKIRLSVWRKLSRLFARELIHDLYLGTMGRKPEPDAMAAMTERAKGAKSPARVITDFFHSEECRQRSLEVAAPGLVKAAFQGLLGREPGADEMSGRASRIKSGGDVTALLQELTESAEFRSKRNPHPNKLDENAIRLGYKFLLGRDPESDSVVKGHLVQSTIANFRAAVLTSEEFRQGMRGPFTALLRHPQLPRPLGPRPEALNILALGTCQIGGLLNVPGLGYNIKHMLMSTGQHFAVPQVDLTGLDAVVVALTLRALIRDTCMARLRNADDAREVIERCRAMMEQNIAALHPVLKSVPTFFMSFYEPSFNYTGNLINRYDLSSPRYFVQKLNEELSNIVARYSNFYFIDANEILNSVGRMHVQDDIIDESGHASIIGDADFLMDQVSKRLVPPRSSYQGYNSVSFHTAYAGAFWHLLADNLKILRQADSVKLIIVDLDHTLWRGVAADDSLDLATRTEGWPIGFVEALLFFKKRGGLIAICSKNDHEPTIERLKQFWGTRITLEDFVSVKINWKSKPENIAEILSETNLLPDNVVFIDDNPRELDEIRAAYPKMRCLGEDHMDWRRIILRAPETQVPVITEESARRSNLVRARVDRETAAKVMPREEWLKSLKMEQRFFVLRGEDSKYFDRAFELINKTNQFNTTGKRWELAEMKAFLESGGVCLVTSLKDKTIDNGIIGAALIKDGEIAQAVLSCRVFGLGAEVSMGRVATEIALSQAREAGPAGKATGRIIDTGKNFTCHKYYTNLGFQSCNGHFEATQPSEAPDWIAIHVESTS